MKGLFGWVIVLVCWLGGPAVAGPSERLAEIDPVRLAQILVNDCVNPVTGAYCETHADLLAPGAYAITATRRYATHHQDGAISLGPCWQLAFDGDTVHVSVDGWTEVRRVSSDGLRVLNWMRYRHEPKADGTSSLVLESCDGGFCRYQFDKDGLLSSVEYASGRTVRYSYQQASGIFVPLRREDEEGRYLTNEIDLSSGRIVKQWAPLGTDKTPILAMQYAYDESSTAVVDALGNRLIYHSANGRVIAIDTEVAGATYRQERFHYAESGQLESYAVLDAAGAAWGIRAFAYDERGHCLRTTLFGDLTGKGPSTFPIDDHGLPSNADVESVAVHYSYDTAARLIAVREDHGKKVTCTYDSETGVLLAKYLWEHSAIRQRLFFRYDPNGALIETIVDDGAGFERDDMQGVTERRISSTTLREQSPGCGLPVLIDEKYWDREQGKARLLRTTICGYDAKGRCIRQDVFDGTADHQSSAEYQYDAAGRLEKILDTTGHQQTYSYTPNGIQKSETDGQASYRYDLAGRLIVKEIKDSEGRLFTSHFYYSLLGQMVEAIDLYGNSTQSTYDSLRRCTGTHYPAIFSASGGSVRPKTARIYDLLDRPIQTTDANGHMTTLRYNVRGQPVEIQHPDGSCEQLSYNLDGSQRTARDRYGCETHFQRDCFGRVLEKRVVSKDGTSFAMQAFYNSFRLVGMVEPSGVHTFFSYDGAGRIVEAVTQWEQGERQRSFHYDAQGRLQEASERFGVGSQDFSRLLLEGETAVTARILDGEDKELVVSAYLQPPKIEKDVHCDFTFVNALGQKVLQKTVTDGLGKRTLITHDALGHIVDVEERDPMGRRLSHRSLRYDPAGHCVRDQVDGDNETVPLITMRRYGPMHRLEELCEALGTAWEAHTTYRYNAYGLLESLVKPNGTRLNYTYDGLGRLIELSSSDGSVGYRYQWDEHGHPVAIVDLMHGETTLRHYDSLGRLLHETLQNGLAVAFTRDGKGRLTRLELPDHSAVLYHYDAVLLHRIERQDSQGNQRYAHTYERYSTDGHLESERLIGGLGSVTYERDNQGHRKSITSRYWSERINEYDPAGNIRQLEVTDRGGSYRMRFVYDCQGRLVGEGGVGIHQYTYDACHNRIAHGFGQHEINRANQVVETPHAQYTYDANGNRLTMSASEQEVRYEYDALDRLTAVETLQKQRVEYRYDATHRRLSETRFTWDRAQQTWAEPTTVRYLYEASREIAAVNDQGTIMQLQVLGPGITGHCDAAVALEIDGGLYAPIHDHRGSIVCLVDAARGVVAEYARMSAFGEETLYSGSTQPLPLSQAISPWRFSGKRYDAATGLVFFGRRYYDADLGRWLTRDPLEEIDGINDYAFVRNNPVGLVDADGLFSLQAVWRGFSEAALEYFRGVGSVASTFVDLFQRDLNFVTDIGDTAMYIGHQLIGPRIWDVVGFYSAQPESGVVGHHEVSDTLRFSHINGIQNTREDALRAVAMISDLHGGVNIHYTYRPTAGWTWDCVNACLAKVGFTSPTAHCLADKWKRLIADVGGIGGGGTIIHYAHSQGGVETENARHLLSADEQGMIRVFTFGSPMLLTGEGFKSVTNYVSRLDIVPMTDPVNYLTGFFGSNDTVVFVGTYWGIPLLDHSLVYAVYRQVLDGLGKNYRE